MMWDGTGWGWMGGMGWGGMLVAALITLAIIAAVVLAVVQMVRPGQGTRRVPGAGADPEELLAQRFARGEIDEQEYRLRLEVLSGER